jgi:hypothetical protein
MLLLQMMLPQTSKNVCATVETRRQLLLPSSARLRLLQKVRILQN